MKDFHRFFSDLCGLGAFAGDTPRLGAALPRRASVVFIQQFAQL
jgi:hypothetical protein